MRRLGRGRTASAIISSRMAIGPSASSSPAPSSFAALYAPGTRVIVTQQVPKLGNGGETMVIKVEGTIEGFEQMKTGSWFAHSKDHKFWLDRLRLRKDDGEIVYLNLDQYSGIEVVKGSVM